MRHRPLTSRERRCLELLVCFHQEFGLHTTVTSTALTHLSDEPWAASLSQLCRYGLVERMNGMEHGIAYRMTEQGWAEFAGVPELATP